MINIADLKDPDDPLGRSYRQVNAAKSHKHPVGALVEFDHGPRLWVVHHARDCDQTPLYCLSFDPHDTKIKCKGFFNPSWITGISEDSLTYIRMIKELECE